MEDTMLVAVARHNIGFALMLRGQYEPAFQCLSTAFQAFYPLRDVRTCGEITDTLAALAALRGDLRDAARLAGTADALRHRVGARANVFERLGWRIALSTARSKLGVAAWDEAFEAARRRSVAEGLSYVDAVCGDRTARPPELMPDA